MKHFIEAATDAASLVLFDPAALPDDFDRRRSEDPADLMAALHQEGKLWSIDSGGDGFFWLQICLAEPIPEELKANATDPERFETFPVPSGKVYFTGAEYAFQSDDSLLRQTPKMKAFAEVPPGTYRLLAYRMKYPEGFREEKLRDAVGPLAYFTYQSYGWMVIGAIAAVLALIFSYFNLPPEVWFGQILPVLGLVVLLPLLLGRQYGLAEARARWQTIQQEYPHYLAHLERVS